MKLTLKEIALKEYILNNYKKNFRQPEGCLTHPFLVPGADYASQLWDWDSWLTGYALMGINDPDIKKYQKGCVLEFLSHQDEQGRIPILVQLTPWELFDITENYKSNIHKPCLAIHALEISEEYNDYSWIKDSFNNLLRFEEYYFNNQYDLESGLFYWLDDLGIGFDNDPTVFYKPDKSVGAIYLNSLMYSELLAVSKLAKGLGLIDVEQDYLDKAEKLKKAIQNECFDEVDGYFYSADLSLRKVDPNTWLHSGDVRKYHSLPIKITTWAGMLPLWNKVATKSQAERAVKHYLNKEGLYSDFGIRSVAKNEKMFANVASGNPSCWLGPIWINANYFTYIGLKNYGYDELANEIREKTISLLANDIEQFEQFHEYYHSETGEGIRGLGFQSWNFLVLRMLNDKENER